MIAFTPFTLFFLTALWVVLEVGLLFSLADEIGALWVVLEVILSFLLGVHVIRSRFWAFFNSGGYTAEEMEKGNISLMSEIQMSLVALFAGFFLILPGLITDGIGLVIMLPFLGRIVSELFAKTGAMDYTRRKIFDEDVFGKNNALNDDGYTSRSQTTIIETEYYEVSDDDDKKTNKKGE